MSTARSLDGFYLSAGARKEQQRSRHYATGRRRRPVYAELHAVSGFSFLDGAAEPEDLIERAVELELPAIALTDRNGVYGAPRLHKAAKEAGIRALVGAELVVGDRTPQRRRKREPVRVGPEPGEQRLTLLVANRTGYRGLCRLLTAAARDRIKGRARADLAMVEAHAEGLWCLSGGEEGPVAAALQRGGPAAARAELERLAAIFPGRLAVEIQRHGIRAERHAEEVLVDLARRLRLPLVATNGVRYAKPEDRALHDLMVCLRHGVTLDGAGSRLEATRERYLKGAREMGDLFADLPAALGGSLEVASALDFTLADLGYRFPDAHLPPGETPASHLRQLTWAAAPARFRPLSIKAQRQLEHELALIEKLDLAGYFLIVHEVVQFCRERGILAQGRGSAANSAVCYALGITAVDPVKMGLLFERFLSEERGEWPDIDLDLPSGDPRESVIQHVYQRYGPHGAAMTATNVTWRDKSSAREVAKALGFAPDQVDRLAKRLGTWGYDVSRGDPKSLATELGAAGFDPEDRRIQLFAVLWKRMQNRPRHLGQHSGGMVLAKGRLDEVVPLEPASMDGRVVVQWDKDDCADLGLIKVDLLGLGMLQVLAEVVPIIAATEGVQLDLAHLPQSCAKTWKMIQQADTVGVFQIESRAQMASLPRNRPERFYDLVIQVAIIRPGPIMGGMVHPFFERRLGREKVVYPHPSLEPILERTLGVPLFQEQILRVAMVAAGFSGGEAEELRRAMGFKRSVERMESIERRLRSGMTERGIGPEAQEQIVKSITSFALYGFPESHAASFALIAWASAYIRAHHPTAFLASILNAWPMGFYYPATLIKDAERHGVEVRPIDVMASGWECGVEREGKGNGEGGRSEAVGARRGAPIARAVARTERDGAVVGAHRDGAVVGTHRGDAVVGAHRDAAVGGTHRDAAVGGAHRDAAVGGTYRDAAVGGAHRDAAVGGTHRDGAGVGARRGAPIVRAVARTHTPNVAPHSPNPFPTPHSPFPPTLACRLGLRYVKGLAEQTGRRIEHERSAHGPFADVADLARRCDLGRDDLERLAFAGALAGLGLERRSALWQVAAIGRGAGGPLLDDLPIETASPLAPMDGVESTIADFHATGLTTGPHPVAWLRPRLRELGILSAAEACKRTGGRAKVAGASIVRQRPGTAKGILFITLEDETGMIQAIVSRELLQEERTTILGSTGLVIEGLVQSRDGSVSIRAERIQRLEELVAGTPGHDFR